MPSFRHIRFLLLPALFLPAHTGQRYLLPLSPTPSRSAPHPREERRLPLLPQLPRRLPGTPGSWPDRHWTGMLSDNPLHPAASRLLLSQMLLRHHRPEALARRSVHPVILHPHLTGWLPQHPHRLQAHRSSLSAGSLLSQFLLYQLLPHPTDLPRSHPGS